MKIAVIGAGAIGSVVAGYLFKAGQDVVLIGREKQIAKINQDGLKITGARGDETIRVPAKAKLEKECDLVIFTVKTQDLEAAYSANHQYLDQCFVLTSQNGVQADNILSIHFDAEKTLSSIVMFGATYRREGEVVFNFEGDWLIGRPFSRSNPDVQKVAAVLQKAFKVVVSENMTGMKWLKLFVNFNNCLPALTGRSMQETFSDVDYCRLSILLLKEGIDVIKQANIALADLPNFPAQRILGLAGMPIEQAAGIINKTLTTLSKEPLYGSILQSIMRKKTSEIDFINGEVVQLAGHMKLQAPLNRRVVDMVHQVERSGKFFDDETIKSEFKLKERIKGSEDQRIKGQVTSNP